MFPFTKATQKMYECGPGRLTEDAVYVDCVVWEFRCEWGVCFDLPDFSYSFIS